jgi:hypothetical protein
MITRTAIPHSTLRDDVYEGYFIPKGSLSHDTSPISVLLTGYHQAL